VGAIFVYVDLSDGRTKLLGIMNEAQKRGPFIYPKD
jgi:hypothetical protein